jgi:ribosome-associated toxin RatA of RatAB toxin-antitoxin module
MTMSASAGVLLAALGPLAPNAAITVGKAADGRGVAARLEAVVAAPLDDVQAVVGDFARYPEWFPGLTRMQLRGAGEIEATFRFPWPLRTMRERLVVARERSRDRAQVRWAQLDGDFARIEGAWHLRTVDKGRTRVVYSAAVQLRRWIPGWLIARAQRRAATQLMLSLETRAQSLQRARAQRRAAVPPRIDRDSSAVKALADRAQ